MKTSKSELIVIGAGPGGYAAAFYAASHGKKVLLVEQDPQLGGVCLNRGCIPSKALLNACHIKEQAQGAEKFGLSFSKFNLDVDKLREWKDGIIKKLSGGISLLASKYGVTVIRGKAYFENSSLMRIETENGQLFYEFDNVIIATGSKPAIPAAFDLGNKRIMTSTEALEIADIPKKLLVVGGGYIGMELGTVYSGLGSDVVMVEANSALLAGADADLVRPVVKYANTHFKEVRLSTKITKMATKGKQIEVAFQSEEGTVKELYDKVLISIGRTPNSKGMGLENTKIELDDKGFIKVNNKQQTSEPNIYAIGDIAGGLMLAHKASKEAKIAVEVILGQDSIFNHFIPAVVFTHPEIAWCGLTEAEAKAKNIPVKVAKFPWAASGRAMTVGATDGLTKLIIEPETERVLGVGIVGTGAGDLIGEGVLAIEMGASAKDLAETIHPHPTLSETMMEAAEVFYGHSAHVFSGK
jgi:dihydrolipoamide dehydrogenase